MFFNVHMRTVSYLRTYEYSIMVDSRKPLLFKKIRKLVILSFCFLYSVVVCIVGAGGGTPTQIYQ